MLPLSILRHLSDVSFVSGADLAQKLDVSRATVWRAIQTLQSWGIDVFCVRGKGYCLVEPVGWLDLPQIQSYLSPETKKWIQEWFLQDLVDSTNTDLLRRMPLLKMPAVCLAHIQTKGRGRENRAWVAPFGRSLACSLAVNTRQELPNLSALPLVLGLSVIQALEAVGFEGITLKWPNDLWFEGSKLGGILVETRVARKDIGIVAGIGVNERLTASEREKIGQKVTDLYQIAPNVVQLPNFRNRWVAALLSQCHDAWGLFEREGFGPFESLWQKYDALRHKTIIAKGPQWPEGLIGIARGITPHGLLKIDVNGTEHWVHHAEVSIRLDNTN